MSERRTPPSVFRKLGPIGIAVFVLLLGLGSVMPASGLTWPVSPAVSVNTATGAQLYPGYWGGSCTFQNFFYAFWVDGSSVLWVASSSNGAAWNTPVSLLTLTSLATLSITASLPPFRVICAGGASNAMVVIWSTIAAGAAPGIGTTNYIKYEVGAMGSGTVTMSGTIASGPTSNSGAPIKFPNGAGLQLGCANLMNGNVFYCVNDIAGGTNSYAMVVNNVVNTNFSSSYNGSGGAANSMVTAFNGAGSYILYWDVSGQACQYALSSDGVSWTAPQTISSSFCAANTQFYVTTGIATYNGNFYVPTTISNKGYINVINPSGINTVQYNWIGSYLTNGHVFVTTDGLANFVVIGCDQSDSCKYSTTGNAFTSFSAATTFTWNAGSAGAMGSAGASYWGYGIQTTFSSTLEAFAVESATTAATFFVYETVFGIPLTSSNPQSVTVGQCPTKNTATTGLTNNTVIGYTGLTFQSMTLNTITTEVASVNSGHVASETLYMVVYQGTTTGSISASNPALLVGFKTWVLSATSAPQQLSWAANINIGSLGSGITYMVGLYGNSKILINQSSLSGMSTATGTGATPPVSVTAFTSSGTQLFLCGVSTFQSIVTTTVTSTTTSTVTSGGSATTTVSTTTTLTSLSSNAALGNSVGVAFVLLILLAPAFAIAIPLGVYTKSPIGAGLGFVSGLAIGALLGNQGGLIPFSVLAGLMIVIVLLIVGFIFALRGSGG